MNIQKIPNEWRYFDADTGMILPWYTSTCLEWLTKLNFSGENIFEYGVGDSTTWYYSRGANLWGVDSNWNWVKKAEANSQVGFARDKQTYLKTIGFKYVKFDLIIIDGIWRDECTHHAIPYLNSGGYLIIDNWEQPSVEPNDWTLTKALIPENERIIYKEPNHPDWSTLVWRKP